MVDTRYPARSATIFRGFAMRRFRRPTVDLADLGPDESQDFLKLALLSTRAYMAHGFRNRRADGAPFAVYPAYLDCISLNAFAGVDRGVHLCGVNVGLAASAFEFAQFCFAQSAFFRSMGDPSQERDPLPIEGRPPGFWIREAGRSLNQADFLRHMTPILPKDGARNVAALMLTMLMIRFVWLHELYHALNGHVGLVAGDGAAFCLHERDEIETAALSDANKQRLEMDADKSSFYALLLIQIQNGENIKALEIMPFADRLTLSVFAAYAAIWMLEEHRRRSPDSQGDAHPAPYLRQHNLIRTFASNIAPLLDDPKDAHDRVLAEMTAMSRILPSLPSGERLVADMRDAAFQAEMDREQIALEALWARLDPWRYVAPQGAAEAPA